MLPRKIALLVFLFFLLAVWGALFVDGRRFLKFVALNLWYFKNYDYLCTRVLDKRMF